MSQKEKEVVLPKQDLRERVGLAPIAKGDSSVTQIPGDGRVPMTHGGYDATDLGAGFEDFSAGDFKMPLLQILQTNSPQVNEEKGVYIKGAKPGMILNTISNRVYDGKTKGIDVVPVHRIQQYIHWIAQKAGGGLVSIHEPTDPLIQDLLRNAPKFGKILIPSTPPKEFPDELADTRMVYCLLLGELEGSFEPVAIPMASSNIGPFQSWMTMAYNLQVPMGHGMMGRPPMFSHKYTLKTEYRENTKGAWYGWLASFAENPRLDPASQIFHEAKHLREIILAGKARVEFVQDADTAGAAPSTGIADNSTKF